MSVWKPPTSRFYQFDFQFRGQRFHGSTGLTSKRDAERFEADRRREVALGLTTKPEITLDAACELYWKERGKAESAAPTTLYQLASLCSLIGGRKHLSTITLADFEAYTKARHGMVGQRSKRPLSNASINREWQLARRVWKIADKAHAVSAIEWAKLKLEEPAERVRELRPDQERALLHALNPDLRGVVEFATLAGQRKTAVITLRKDAIDWSGPRATVCAKGGGEHTFPLTPRMVVLILAQPTVAGCPFVFTYTCRKSRQDRRKGVRYPFSAQGWRRQWIEALDKAGIQDFRFHDLRHTSATRLMRATGNLKAAQKLLGHTNIATTARYAHVNEDDLRDALAASESRNSPKQRFTERAESGRKAGEIE